MSGKRQTRIAVCEKIWKRTMVIRRAWIREKVVNSISADSPQCEWDRVAEHMMLTFAESGQKSLPCQESIVQRSVQKQRRRKTVDTLLCRPGDD